MTYHELVVVIWLMTLPTFTAAYTLLKGRISLSLKARLRVLFVLYTGLFVASSYLLMWSVSSPLQAAFEIISFAPFIAANALIAVEKPLQRRSWLLIPLTMCIWGIVSALLVPLILYKVPLQLEFGAYGFLIGLASAVVLEVWDVGARRAVS